MDVLKHKSYHVYDRLSRYNNFPYYYHTKDDKYTYGVTAHLDKSTPYVLHTVKRNDSIDSLALEYYNNPTYFWIICDFNNIQNPYTKLNVGDRLKVPVFSSIKFDM